MLIGVACHPTPPSAAVQQTETKRVKLGAEVLLEQHLDKLRERRIGVLAHRASVVYDGLHLVDALLARGIAPVRIFAPEHGFRGQAEAGALINDMHDPTTGLLVVSLYGKNKKPLPVHLQDLDLVLIDLQDVGARFYTYLSTLTYMLEACAEAGVEVWVLDRPNPNGQYVSGPTLELPYRSFIGLHPIPVVHGMTLGEMARLIRAEGWIAQAQKLKLTVVAAQGYRHRQRWSETGLRWIPPSPNLPTAFSAEIYPLICWFEGTDVSVGRGTDAPFEQVGAPWHRGLHRQFLADRALGQRTELVRDSLRGYATAFVPKPIAGVAENPPHRGDSCFALRITQLPEVGPQRFRAAVALLENMYHEHREALKAGKTINRPFFSPQAFDRLVGNSTLRQTIENGQTTEPLLEAWEREARRFRRLREAWRLYPD